ncbi:MAG: UbiA family prenyltransferase [Planctomycetaceae bacterium]
MQKLRAYLRLMRIPAVFTAMADILLGFLLTHSSLLLDGCPLPFCLLLLCSSSLYLAGMIFNDVFDVAIDTIERPGRPIPSGDVPIRKAVLLGTALILVGLTSAVFVNLQACLIALILTGAIFAYDGFLKKTRIGPVAMGSCRFLNVMLGCSAKTSFSEIWTAPNVNIALALAVYIAGVTWFARNEATESDRRQLTLASVVITAGLCGLLFLGINADYGVGGNAPPTRVSFAWFAIVLVISRVMLQAISNPTPKRVQFAVKTMLQWLILLDATMIYAATGDAVFAVATALLMAPMLLLGHWVYMT